MKKIKVTIEGTTPLLMNRYSIEAQLEKQAQGGRRIGKVYSQTDEAEKSAYFTTKGKKELMIPAGVIYASILNASYGFRIAKKSAKSIFAGSIRIEPAEISLGKSKYEVDIRPVVIKGSRVLKGRARIDEWKASFDLLYAENQIGNSEIIKQVLEDAGQRIGIMDFRPNRSGYYGTFIVTKFEEVKEKTK